MLAYYHISQLFGIGGRNQNPDKMCSQNEWPQLSDPCAADSYSKDPNV